MNDWLIVNADIVNENHRFTGDVRIKDGRIDAVASSLPGRANDRVFDAGGRLLIPGMIDDQVHMREPGLEHKGDFYTESRAAVAGGVTSFMEMPNSKPTTTDYAARTVAQELTKALGLPAFALVFFAIYACAATVRIRAENDALSTSMAPHESRRFVRPAIEPGAEAWSKRRPC